MDVALIRLDSAAPSKGRVRRTINDSKAPTGSLKVVGFGANDPTGTRGAGLLRPVDIPATGWGCDGARAKTTGCVPDFEMVLGKKGTGDSCNGDSGGPTFEATDKGYRLVSITSRAVRNAKRACGEGGISTRVDRLDTWINSVIGKSK